MKYQIVHAASLSQLEEAVNEEIAQGFIPRGGVCAYYTASGNLVYVQAMIDFNS